jgi:hypothetical protein
MGIAFTGAAPVQTNVLVTVGMQGPGGDPGSGTSMAPNQGGLGVSCRVYDFGTSQCVTP